MLCSAFTPAYFMTHRILSVQILNGQRPKKPPYVGIERIQLNFRFWTMQN